MESVPPTSSKEHRGITAVLRHRFLWGLANYPMVLLLAIVLVSVHVAEHFGWKGWLVSASGFVVVWLGRSLIGNGPSKASRPTSLVPTFVCMIAIGGAFAFLHDYTRSSAARRQMAWERSRDGMLDEQPQLNVWKPLIARAIIDDAIRYRRSSIPNARPDESKSADDESTAVTERWQSIARLRLVQTKQAEGWVAQTAAVSLVVDAKLVGYYPGDQVELYGEWRLPPEPSNPGQYDLRKRYGELGLNAQVRVDSEDQFKRIGTDPWPRMDRWLAKFSAYALSVVERDVPFGQAPLTAALVLGQREQAQWQLQEELLATGTIHMLSISGMHIEMVAVALIIGGIAVGAPRNATWLGTVVLCTLYALLCGANPPVARATLMLIAGSFARWFGWQFTSLNVLALAALLILSQRTTIAFEVGSQLSFLTVAVLILTFPILNQRRSPLDRLLESRQNTRQRVLAQARHFAWESLRSSFWVCFLSAPLVWNHFHIISPIAVVLNLVLWLPMLVALLTGLALVVLGWIPPVAAMLGIACGASLWLLEQIVQIAEGIPYGHLWRAAPPSWWLYGFYGIALTQAIWLGTRRARPRQILWRSLAVWFVLGLIWEPSLSLYRGTRWTKEEGGTLAATWLDVGHGTCVVIETPDGEVWVYDAGRLGDHERSYQPIANALWHMGHSRLDRLILSHADSDHYNAMPGLVERFSPKRFITTASVQDHAHPSLRTLFHLLERDRVPIEIWQAGSRYDGQRDWQVDVLHPGQKQVAAPKLSDNAKSLVLLLRNGARAVLLPGDLEPPGTQQMLSLKGIHADVMMAPHHGSLEARAERLVAWCRPSWVVVSGATRAVTDRVLNPLRPEGGDVLITARDHALRVEFDRFGAIAVKRWKNGGWSTVESRN